MTKEQIFEKVKLIANTLDKKKAKDIKILYVHDQTVIADYFVIAHGTSTTQVKALADEVDYILGENNTPCSSIEGRDGGNWIVLDCDDVLVHVFHSEQRSYYNLEKLWADAELIPFEPDTDPAGESK